MGRLTFVTIAMSFILVEGVPMLAAWLKREMVREAREQGRSQEREAWLNWRRELQAWEQRKAAAESEGGAFDEPPPEAPADP